MEARSARPEASFHPRKLGRDLAPAAVSPPFLCWAVADAAAPMLISGCLGDLLTPVFSVI